MKTIVRMVDVPINDWNNQTKGTVTLEISDGEFVLLLGPNGSGKSYLLNLMAALRVPRVGEVFLEGKRLTIIVRDEDVNAYLSFRNIPKTFIITADEANTYDLVNNNAVLMPADIAAHFGEVLA
mgnify:CR=1 FL=1